MRTHPALPRSCHVSDGQGAERSPGNSAEHQDASTAVFHQRLVVARRDVGDSSPAAPIAFPAVPDDFPRGAIHRLPRTSGDDGSSATGIVGGTGIDAAGRSGIRHRLPLRATPAPDLVTVALLWIAGATDEHNPPQPQVVEPEGVIRSRCLR